MMMQTEYNAGLTDGIKQEKIEIAKKMLEKGMTEDEISELTQLSVEEISKIKETIV